MEVCFFRQVASAKYIHADASHKPGCAGIAEVWTANSSADWRQHLVAV